MLFVISRCEWNWHAYIHTVFGGIRTRTVNSDQYRFLSQVVGKVGKGAYGGVWQAKVLSSGQEVVLKVVFPDPDLDPVDTAKSNPTPDQLQCFKREIEILSIVGEHPNIASLLGFTMDFRVLVLQVCVDRNQGRAGVRVSRSCCTTLNPWSEDIFEPQFCREACYAETASAQYASPPRAQIHLRRKNHFQLSFQLTTQLLEHTGGTDGPAPDDEIPEAWVGA